MTKQEENWELMTILSIPWHEAAKITDATDRRFLLEKCTQVKAILKDAEAQKQQVLEERSNIITPTQPTII